MISIICYIPFYHGNILNSIKSVLCQNYKDWELLISYNKIDKKLVELFTNPSFINDYNIYITYFEDKDRTFVLNDLTYKSKYEWIALLDSHTIWCFDKLEQQMFIVSGNKYSVIGTNINFISMPTRDLQNINFF